MKRLYAKMTFRIVLISFLALMLIGCGESGTPGGAAGPGVTASISLTAGSTTAPADGVTSTTITASLVDSVNSSVSANTSVVFHTSQGTFKNGSDTYRVSTADDSGIVTVALISDTSAGTAEVSAESSKVSQKVEVKFYDPNKVGTISIRTGSSSITADGTSTVSVIATVTDASGNPEDGATVTFKTSLGEFVNANPLPGIINRTTTADTDVDGEVAVILVSGKTIGTATILASINGLNAPATVTFTADVPKTITLRAAPSTVRPTGNTDLFATLKDINGNPVAGQTVVFSQTANGSDGSLNILSATTNVNGEAQSTYTAGENPGTDTIQAALGSDVTMKAETDIVVDTSATVVNTITVTAGSADLVADGTRQVNIRALVIDTDGNPAVSKTVNFTTTAGTLSSATGTTDENGMAQVQLQSTTIAGPATVSAESDGFIGRVSVEFIPGPADHIIFYAFPDTVPPGGAFQTAAIIQDKYDNRIDDQRLMLQVRLAGHTEIVDSAEMTPDQAQDGVFRFDWTAATEYGSGNLEVTASVNNGVSNTVTVVVDESATIVGSISLTAGAEAIKADASSSVLIRATVLDSAGDPLSGVDVEFETTLGTLSSSTKETDQNGVADVLLKSGTAWGTATVTANANGFWAETDVQFTSLKAGGVSIAVMPDNVLPGGQATVIAELHDGKGDPISGEDLYFDLYENNTNATLSAISGTTDTNGRVTITYTAGVIVASCTTCDCTNGDAIRVTAASNSKISDETCITVGNPNGIPGQLTLASGTDTLPADGASSTAVTATVFDTAGFAMPEGTEITLDTTLGTFAGGQDPDGSGPISSEIKVSTSDDTGKVIVSLIAPSSQTGVATITATVGDLTQLIQITFESVLIPEGAYLSISASKTSVKTNGTDFATITALVLDVNHVPITGTTVNFGSDGGTISAASVKTDANGQASVTLKSGPDKSNQTVTVTASSGTTLQASIPVVLYGTEITLTPATAQLDTSGSDTQALVIKATDADGTPIYNATIQICLALTDAADTTLSFTNDGTLVTLNDGDCDEMTTNYAGEIALTLTAATTTGSATVTAGGLGMTVGATGTYSIGSVAQIFEITAPTESPYSAPADGTPVTVTVHGGGLASGDNVVFATSFGSWAGSTSKTVVKAVDGSLNASLDLTSNQAGVATVQVYAEDTAAYPDAIDTVQISFFNPAERACDIIIEASQYNILPSTDTSQYSLTIEASVVDIYGAPVGDATVNFYLSNTTGGGEYLFPVTAVTDAAGLAHTTFTSGTQSTGSEDPSSAVLVTARVATDACDAPGDYHDDTLAIVISGAVANVSLGYANVIAPNADNTLYYQPVSVLVADTNGNPVPGATVSLSLKPSRFATGHWLETGSGGHILEYYNPCFGFGSVDPYVFVNEDLNNNAILDNNEDELNRYTVGATGLPDYFTGYDVGDYVPGLDNGTLTPGQSAGGAIPSSVTTDENGVVSFILTYQKEYAVWVEDQITATAMVYGTEYITKSRKWLPYLKDEEDAIASAFPESPFNNLPCGIATAP